MTRIYFRLPSTLSNRLKVSEQAGLALCSFRRCRCVRNNGEISLVVWLKQ